MSDAARGPLPIRVRWARPSDRDAVMAFATRTWGGWDYIPHAWADWIDSPDGVFLVALPRRPEAGEDPQLDADGRALDPDVPIAITHLVIASPTEAWLEGIRVDPRVRGRSVATHLQIAELHWAAAHGVDVIRYLTGEDNEASHRLGARHGLRVVAALRSYVDPDADVDTDEAGEAVEPVEPADVDVAHDRRLVETGRLARSRTLGALAGLGLVVERDAPAGVIDRLWAILEHDPTLRLAAGLYEYRPWAFRTLTRERFAAHVARGEVVVDRDGPDPAVVAVLDRDAASVEDAEIHLSVVAGQPEAALRLLATIRERAGEPVRVRLPDPDPPLIAGDRDAWARAGYPARGHATHILVRPLTRNEPLPDPTGMVEFEDPPRPTATAPAI